MFMRRRRTDPWMAGMAVRAADRDAAVRRNMALNFAETDDEASTRFIDHRSRDPFPSIPPALLNSADIADYAAATGMLVPFHPDKLKSASYEVAALGTYVLWRDGKPEQGDLKEGDQLELPRNSILFLTVEPYFRLPDYIALRHNLKIEHIYKGLLVGTGPLIDPGFVGRIALPLHNLTENSYFITGGQGIIWVEFTKLSPHPSWSESNSRVRRGSYVNFPAEKSAGRTVVDYINRAVEQLPTPESSSSAISRTASEALKHAQSAQKRVLTFGTIGTLAIAGIVATLAAYFVDLEREIGDLKTQIAVMQSSGPSPSSTSAGPIKP